MSKKYLLEPELGKSSYDEELYCKDINGQEVYINIVSYYRWSEFEICLDEEEKKEILSQDEIILSNYDIEFISSDSCIRNYVEIKDEKKYNKDFISKIYENIYGKEDDSENDSFCDSIRELEENGWCPCEVTYGLTCKCKLTEI